MVKRALPGLPPLLWPALPWPALAGCGLNVAWKRPEVGRERETKNLLPLNVFSWELNVNVRQIYE